MKGKRYLTKNNGILHSKDNNIIFFIIKIKIIIVSRLKIKRVFLCLYHKNPKMTIKYIATYMQKLESLLESKILKQKLLTIYRNVHF